MFTNDMTKLLSAIKPYVVEVSFKNPETDVVKTITTYTGTPEPEYYNASLGLFKAFNLNFIELTLRITFYI